MPSAARRLRMRSFAIRSARSSHSRSDWDAWSPSCWRRSACGPARWSWTCDRRTLSISSQAVRDAQATTSRHEIVLAAPTRLRAKLDALRFAQVVGNLLDNAIKFSPKGGRVEVELSSPKRRAVRLAVRDHGIGIASEDRPHIFERFYRSQPSDQRSGLGLGLYVSREIVELHGGRIETEAPDDGGTRMVVSLSEGR